MQKPRGIDDENPPTAMPLRHDGLCLPLPDSTPSKDGSYDYFDPIAQKPFDVNYKDQEDVHGLTAYRFTQPSAPTAEGKLVAR